jgi:serine/threonine protein kinase/tetratricopeptide (TPR) repeat protein
MNEETLFAEALGQQGAARAAFLDEHCKDDVELRKRLEGLLRAHDHPDPFLEAAAPVNTVDEPLREAVGTIIGPYKLIEQIGEGGMGTVWMAQQTEPVRRLVAVKLIKAGMDSKQVIARFEAERQALALMDHANIARVLDAGTSSAGRPYFVMDLVKGVPITKYCDEHHLTPRQRLDLFIPVCQAVQHAHQKGIIHRDLKPSNVLVALYDGKPVPKVIDFGVAKAAGQSLTEKTLVTGFGNIVGTLEYMSPEQAEINQLDIDTRSDIYSLGVLLYELLAGSPPFTRKELEKAGMLEMLRVIREQEPSKPSTKLSTAEALPTLAAERGTEPAKLTKLVRGELDWIVMKALEKDRNRRYETANGFAMDVQRYLADEPVQACPPSTWYRFRKFARRNRGRLTATAVLGVALLVTVGGIGWAVRDRAAVAEQTAKDKAERQEKLEARINQALEETQAEYERDNLPEARTRIQRIDALLAGDTGVGDEVRHRVDEWRAELAILQRLEDLALVPSERSRWLQTDAAYARVFRDIGIDIDALPPEEAGRRIRTHLTWKWLTEALDEWAWVRHEIIFPKPPAPEAGLSKKHLLQVARAADPDELRTQARLAVEKWDVAAAERLAGSPEVRRLPAAALRHLAMVIYYGNTGGNTQSGRDSAVRLLLNALLLRPGDVMLNTTCANWYGRMQPPRWAEAAHYLSIGVALRPENPGLRLRLAEALREQGRLDDAVAQLREAIRINKDYAYAYINLGVALNKQGKRDEAIAEYRKAIALDPECVLAHSNLGGALHEQGLLDEAVTECRKAIALDPAYAPAHVNLGNALFDQGKRDEAVAEHRKAIDLDSNHAVAHSNLGAALYDQGKPDEAIAEWRKAIDLDPKLAQAHVNLGAALCQQGKLDEGVAEFQKAIALEPDSAHAHCAVGKALLQQGEFRRALEELRRGHELGSKRPGWAHPTAHWVRQAERLVEFDAKLPSILKGEAKPTNGSECLELALMCLQYKKLNHAAAELFDRAFTEERQLAEDLGPQHRYNAACAAALAGCGHGKDVEQSDAKERTRLRRQALDWLRADLAAWGRVLEKEPEKIAPMLTKTMQHWEQDTDFAGVRGSEALAKLPEAERQEWQKLWDNVADMLKKAQGKAVPEMK